MSSRIQFCWEQQKLLGMDCVLFASGKITIMSFGKLFDVSNGISSYYAHPSHDTWLESIEAYSDHPDDPWKEIQRYDAVVYTERNEQVVCGEGSMGNEGFIALTDDKGNLVWALFSNMSNPFLSLKLEGRMLYAYSTAPMLFLLDLDAPHNVKVRPVAIRQSLQKLEQFYERNDNFFIKLRFLEGLDQESVREFMEILDEIDLEYKSEHVVDKRLALLLTTIDAVLRASADLYDDGLKLEILTLSDRICRKIEEIYSN